MNNPSQTKDMNLKQALEDWINVQDTHPTNLRTKYRNELRAELRASLPSLLAKIEQHVLEARKDELETLEQTGTNTFRARVRHVYTEQRIAEIDASLSIKGRKHEK